MSINIYTTLNWYSTRVLMVSSLIILSTFVMSAQDIHYTQFFNAPFQVSPSQIGLFDGHIRVQANYRNQWKNVPVGFNTFTAAVDKKFYSRRKQQFFAGGLVINYDQAGDSQLNHNQVKFLGSFTRRTSNKTYVTLGGIFALNQRSFKLSDLQFGNQFDGQGGSDPALDSQESFPDLTNNYGDYSIGINFRFQEKDTFLLVDKLEKRTKLDVGIGFYHLNTPNQSFSETIDAPLPIRFSPYVFGTLQLSDNLDFVGSFLGQFQSSYEEFLYGIAIKYHLNRQPGKQWAIQAGLSLRSHDFGDSLAPVLELNYNSWRVGFSYDVSRFRRADADRRNYDGPEISVQYIFKKVPNLPKYKICPLI